MPRLYRLLLGLAPRRLRESHGDDMTELFAERLGLARGRGRPSAAAICGALAAERISESLIPDPSSWIPYPRILES